MSIIFLQNLIIKWKWNMKKSHLITSKFYNAKYINIKTILYTYIRTLMNRRMRTMTIRTANQSRRTWRWTLWRQQQGTALLCYCPPNWRVRVPRSPQTTSRPWRCSTSRKVAASPSPQTWSHTLCSSNSKRWGYILNTDHPPVLVFS